jgi:hypothetical protein
VIVFVIAVRLNGSDTVAFVPFGTNTVEYQLAVGTASCRVGFDEAAVTTRRTAPVTIHGPAELIGRVIV